MSNISSSFIKDKQEKRPYRRKSPVMRSTGCRRQNIEGHHESTSDFVRATFPRGDAPMSRQPEENTLSQKKTNTRGNWDSDSRAPETLQKKSLFKRKKDAGKQVSSETGPSSQQLKNYPILGSDGVQFSEAHHELVADVSVRILSEVNEKYSSEIEEISYDIESIYFNFLSEEEIERLAVVEITDPKYNDSTRNGLYDLRMGPLNNNDICETCESNYKDCQGHFGYINLAVKIPHPLRSKSILEYLSLFCKNKKCHRLIIKEEKIHLLEINKYKNDNRYKKILNEAYNTKVCPYCETIIPSYSCMDDKYIFEIKGKKYPLRYEEIYNIFSNIRETDIELLGFSDLNVHPVNLILTKLIVVPPCVRSFTKTDDGESRHDDLTVRYSEVIKTNNKIKLETKEKTIIDETDRLLFHIKTLMDNNKGKARDNNGTRPIKCIKKRLSGKQGRIRQNIQGKRSEFCARTVIGADALCRVDELVMPEEIARTLSYPVKVNKFNMNYCYKLLNDNKVNYIIRGDVMKSAKIVLWTQGFKVEKGDKVIRNGVYIDPDRVKLIKGSFDIKKGDKVLRKGQMITNVFEKLPKRKHYELQEGDIIERQLQNGDLGVFNRQPTLWKGSMRAKRIKILPGKTFRFNLASTQAFNADFDGDEIDLQMSL
jgi:DNA-directed RNA polymerase beta' subunit